MNPFAAAIRSRGIFCCEHPIMGRPYPALGLTSANHNVYDRKNKAILLRNNNIEGEEWHQCLQRAEPDGCEVLQDVCCNWSPLSCLDERIRPLVPAGRSRYLFEVSHQGETAGRNKGGTAEA